MDGSPEVVICEVLGNWAADWRTKVEHRDYRGSGGRKIRVFGTEP